MGAPPVADAARAQRVQRSAGSEPALTGEAYAGHRKPKTDCYCAADSSTEANLD